MATLKNSLNRYIKDTDSGLAYDRAAIMKWAHFESGTTYSAWKASHKHSDLYKENPRGYVDILSTKLKQVWADAQNAMETARDAGSAADALAEIKRKRELKYRKEEIAKRGEKTRVMVRYSRRRETKKQIESDENKAFDGFGKSWRLDNDCHATGQAPLGWEGQRVCYAYYYEMPEHAGDGMPADVNAALPY